MFDKMKIWKSLSKAIKTPIVKEQATIVHDAEITVPFVLPMDLERIMRALSAAQLENGIHFNVTNNTTSNSLTFSCNKGMAQAVFETIKSAVFDGAEVKPDDQIAPKIEYKDTALAAVQGLVAQPAQVWPDPNLPTEPTATSNDATVPIDSMGPAPTVTPLITGQPPDSLQPTQSTEDVPEEHPVADQIAAAAPGPDTAVTEEPTTDVEPDDVLKPEEAEAIEGNDELGTSEDEEMQEDMLIDPSSKKPIEPKDKDPRDLSEDKALQTVRLLTEMVAKKMGGLSAPDKKKAIKMFAESLGLKAQVRKAGPDKKK